MDIMLKAETRLSTAHDIAKTLRYFLEGLSEVDRAFVRLTIRVKGLRGMLRDKD